MIVQIPVSLRKNFSDLFSGQTDTMIQSCLQGFHGTFWTDHPKDPSCGRILCGDFCFLGGDASAPGAKELIRQLDCPLGQKILIFVPSSPEWEALLRETYGDQLVWSRRYGLKKEDAFDRSWLKSLISSLPEGYRLQQINAELYEPILAQGWCRDFVSNFSPESFALLGLGFVVLKGKEIVAGASSYTRYRDGIEIEIATRKDQRQQGLAAICGAALILECLNRGLYPSWDAANPVSLHLAQKLGYHFAEEYPVCFLSFDANTH